MREYAGMVEALEKEKDPIAQYKIVIGIFELEDVLKKRMMLKDYLDN